MQCDGISLDIFAFVPGLILYSQVLPPDRDSFPRVCTHD